MPRRRGPGCRRFRQAKIRAAKRRIFIASLYVGKEETELVRPAFLSSPVGARRELTAAAPPHLLRPVGTRRSRRSGPSTLPCAATPRSE